jgi:polar amino acid transport system substrate-binding protein
MFARSVIGLLFAVALASVAASDSYAELTIATSYAAPYSTDDEDGILDLLIKEAGRRAGIEISVVQVPAERSIQDANTGSVDGDIGRIYGIEKGYPNLVRIDEPIIPRRDFVAFSRPDIAPIENWDDLAGNHVAYVRGWKIVEENVGIAERAFPVDNSRQAMRMLARERVDIALTARLDGGLIAAELGISPIVVHEPPLASRELYPYLHRDHAERAPELASAIRNMKEDGTFNRYYEQWLGRIDED